MEVGMQMNTRASFRRAVMFSVMAAICAMGASAFVHAQGTARDVALNSAPEMLERICADREARAAGHLAFISIKVGIKPDQTADWEAFTAASMAAVAAFNPCKAGPLPIDDPIAMRGRLEQVVEDAYVFFTSMRNAADTLNSGLDPQQQLRFAVALLPPALQYVPRP
jgi:hypothetical protein